MESKKVLPKEEPEPPTPAPGKELSGEVHEKAVKPVNKKELKRKQNMVVVDGQEVSQEDYDAAMKAA